MTSEDYLMGYRLALAQIQEIDGDIEAEELRQTRVAAKYDGNPVQGSGDPNAKLDPLGELILRRKAAVDAAEEKRREIRKFIATVGSDSEKDRRSRQILRLYYVEELDWRDVQRLIKPLKTRSDGRMAPRRKGCVSEPTLYRERGEALRKADLAFRRMNKYAR